ncbi:hypothetical protein RJ639_006245 [Escallonia herrerae]|uniref:Uncharacterized protein n=1 Tax=Escallonia herrerae TaxID=1293975 RepID=A0AA89AVW1_9ASTE|nr:hypothetical protein RJ639_006245 [Escallonia herrerae]
MALLSSNGSFVINTKPSSKATPPQSRASPCLYNHGKATRAPGSMSAAATKLQQRQQRPHIKKEEKAAPPEAVTNKPHDRSANSIGRHCDPPPLATTAKPPPSASPRQEPRRRQIHQTTEGAAAPAAKKSGRHLFAQRSEPSRRHPVHRSRTECCCHRFLYRDAIPFAEVATVPICRQRCRSATTPLPPSSRRPSPTNLPKGVSNYDLNPTTGKFLAHMNGTCSFKLENNYELSYKSTIKGVISRGKLEKLNGATIKKAITSGCSVN